MDAADMPTIKEILAEVIDVDDPHYATMIEALRNRENVMISDAVDHAMAQQMLWFETVLSNYGKHH